MKCCLLSIWNETSIIQRFVYMRTSNYSPLNTLVSTIKILIKLKTVKSKETGLLVNYGLFLLCYVNILTIRLQPDKQFDLDLLLFHTRFKVSDQRAAYAFCPPFTVIQFSLVFESVLNALIVK